MEYELVYLAIPYSSDDPKEIEYRVEMLCKIDSLLMKQGVFTVSPVFKHFTLKYRNLPGNWTYWEKYSKNLMSKCDALYIIKLNGWKNSEGIREEIAEAKRLCIPIVYLDPDLFIIEIE